VNITKHKKYALLSNVLFLIPFGFAIFYGVYFFAFLIILTSASSTLYHFKKPHGPDWWHKKGRTPTQTMLLWTDTITAFVLSFYTLLIFAYRGFPLSFWISIILFVPTFIMFMRPDEDHERNHLRWHTVCALVVTLVFV